MEHERPQGEQLGSYVSLQVPTPSARPPLWGRPLCFLHLLCRRWRSHLSGLSPRLSRACPEPQAGPAMSDMEGTPRTGAAGAAKAAGSWPQSQPPCASPATLTS